MGKLGRKLGTILLATSMVGFVATAAMGCSDANHKLERANALNDKLTNVVVAMDEGVQDFRLTGADVDKSGFEYNVSFNGIASLDEAVNAFASVNYKVPHSVFLDLEKDSSTDAVFDVFDYIVDNLKAESVSLAKVGDVEKFNDAIVKNTPSPFDKYRIERGYVYNITDPVFDDATNSVSFDVKTLMELRKKSVKPGFGLGVGFVSLSGAPGIGIGPGVSLFKQVCEGTFMTVDTYSFTFSDEDYQQLKEDPNFIYEICADAINRQDDSYMSVKRQFTNDVTYDNADLLDKLDFNSAVQELDF